jgi:hypothetical protein
MNFTFDITHYPTSSIVTLNGSPGQARMRQEHQDSASGRNRPCHARLDEGEQRTTKRLLVVQSDCL